MRKRILIALVGLLAAAGLAAGTAGAGHGSAQATHYYGIPPAASHA